MVVYNKTRRIITYTSNSSGSVILLPGANLNISETLWSEMKVVMAHHIKTGTISNENVSVKSTVKEDADDAVKVKEKDLLKIVEETFDEGELKKMVETGTRKVKEAAKAQLERLAVK